jgi:hypothetical protein
MEKQTIDLVQRFHAELCTFEMAQKAKEAGCSAANTYFAYDELGEKHDSGWMDKVGIKDVYPCINFPFAASMVADLNLDADKVEFYQENNQYHFKTGDKIYVSANIVDVLVEVWISHKK